MSQSSNRSKAIQAINKKGILLVYPIKNEKEPASIWSELFPRTVMRWDWDETGDQKVSDLWVLREQLSRSGEVIYTKWYQNRATFFSIEVFKYMQTYMRDLPSLPRESREILEALEMDSPLSTKQVKEAAGLQGKFFESAYNRAMKELWKRLVISGFGEVADSSFPSLAVGAAQNLFEEHWLAAQDITMEEADNFLVEKLGADNKFWLYAQKVKKGPLRKSALSSTKKSASGTGAVKRAPSGGPKLLSEN